VIHADGVRHEIPCVEAETLADPTGCGDAYRAGLLYGIARGWEWPRTGRLAALLGAIKIAHRGAQNHRPSRAEIAARYRKAFGASPW
jgi:adenosine kinase